MQKKKLNFADARNMKYDQATRHKQIIKTIEPRKGVFRWKSLNSKSFSRLTGTVKPRYSAPAFNIIPPIEHTHFSPEKCFKSYLYIGNKENLGLDYIFNQSLEISYSGVSLYVKNGVLRDSTVWANKVIIWKHYFCKRLDARLFNGKLNDEGKYAMKKGKRGKVKVMYTYPNCDWFGHVLGECDRSNIILHISEEKKFYEHSASRLKTTITFDWDSK